ncbi:MAG: fructosamine kinase family protein [Bacteroidetes bacterium]|nr:fructosamine kinase family protein [Bacteroidota bacterium]
MINLSELIGENVSFVRRAGGGCIADSAIFSGASGTYYFVKTYRGAGGNLKAGAEEKGLNELAKQKLIRVPKVFTCSGNTLVMEMIKEGRERYNFSENFGRDLFIFHEIVSDSGFGFHENNFIGDTLQQNTPFMASWIDFYREKRLVPQFRMMSQNGYTDKSLALKFDALLKRLPELIDDKSVKPSLLHGDLWYGNVLTDEKGEAVIIDPAVYYGDRETDIAMTELFGGFDGDFYGAYFESYSWYNQYKKRRDVYQLYHLMNHLNLFGSGYLEQVKSIIQKYA